METHLGRDRRRTDAQHRADQNLRQQSQKCQKWLQTDPTQCHRKIISVRRDDSTPGYYALRSQIRRIQREGSDLPAQNHHQNFSYEHLRASRPPASKVTENICRYRTCTAGKYLISRYPSNQSHWLDVHPTTRPSCQTKWHGICGRRQTT